VCQISVDAASAIFDGNNTVASLTGNHGDWFAAVAAQREQEGIQFLVVGCNVFNDIFLAFHSVHQSHKVPPNHSEQIKITIL
jgi:hypothetical protein